MTRFSKIYGKYFYSHDDECKTPKNNAANREGYGYIKRRLGLLSNELDGPTYLALSELSTFINDNIAKK